MTLLFLLYFALSYPNSPPTIAVDSIGMDGMTAKVSILGGCYDMPEDRKVFMGDNGLAAVGSDCSEAFTLWESLPVPKLSPMYKI